MSRGENQEKKKKKKNNNKKQRQTKNNSIQKKINSFIVFGKVLVCFITFYTYTAQSNIFFSYISALSGNGITM